MGAGDSGLANLGDWEETGLEKDDEDFEVGFSRRGKRERGEIRVSMFGAQEKESCVISVSAAAAVSTVVAASMRTVVVRFTDADAVAAAYHIATADFIGVSRRTQRSDAAAGSCINETNKS
ncbi:hypothetical protein IGI04_001999 [Brassica rapa subsp. trilocularis]|uniref:AP2/ERF domain-containing protein n=1 Tax=Brassica rapa subsp. trilocularis TaxID=1813537 RepID=A0ABQ7NU82_BRACM|nr:hypothetical protein IGI04_001999 [Brassica rapa subsp. trilocularis]